MNQIDTEQRRARAISAGKEVLAWWSSEGLAAIGGTPEAAFTAEDPSTEQALWDIATCDAPQIDAAVARARAAQPAWNALPAAEKARYLLACADALEGMSEQLADLLALESGKSLTQECVGELALFLSILRYFANSAHEIKGRSQNYAPGILSYTSHHPYGVVAGIVPWNVPLMLTGYKLAAPLVAGNTVVLKLPEQTSVTLLAVIRQFRAILPDGVVEVLTGPGRPTGAGLVIHPGVDKVSFTGSVPTGQAIGVEAAKLIRPVTLELGGKSPMIILDDCEIDRAVQGILQSMRFTRAGQSCTAASRIYVARDQLDDYMAALGSALDALQIGDALDLRTQCGPVVTRLQRDRVAGFLDRARSQGLDVRGYGARLDPDGPGYFIDPHLVVAPSHEAEINRDEVFGPVATITPYEDLAVALEQSNDTEYGLSASVWGNDIATCLNIADRFHAGIVQVNQNAVMLPGLSYGGVGISGIGKESSREAMVESYMYEKTNIVNFGFREL